MTPLIYSQDVGDISVKASVNKAFITVGDKVEYRIEIKRNPQIEILSSLDQKKLKNFEIKSSLDITPRKEGAQVIEGKTYEITSYTLGEYVIDPITLRFKDIDGKEKEIKTNKLYITVHSIDKKGAVKKDIRGIKGVTEIPSQFWKFFFIIFGAVFFLFLIFLFFFLRKNPHLLDRFKTPPLKIHEAAFQSLNRIKDSGMLVRGEHKAYYYGLSEVIKLYLSKRYKFNAIEETKLEIFKSIKRLNLSEEDVRLIMEYFNSLEMVKYAKHTPQTEEIQKDFKMAWKIIENTYEREAEPLEKDGEEKMKVINEKEIG